MSLRKRLRLHTWFPPSLISRTSIRPTSCMDLQCWQSSLQLLTSGWHMIARLGQNTFWAGTSNILSTCASLWLAEKSHGASGVLDACMSTTAGWSSPLQRMMAMRWWELGRVENWMGKKPRGEPCPGQPCCHEAGDPGHTRPLPASQHFSLQTEGVAGSHLWGVMNFLCWWHHQQACAVQMHDGRGVCVWEVGSQSPK